MRFLTGGSRGGSEIKRGLGHRPGLSAQSRALCPAPGAAWELGFSCPVTDSSRTPWEVGTASPAWKGCGHRRLMPCAPDATLSVSYESSHLMTPTAPLASIPFSGGANQAREGQPIAQGSSPTEGALNSHPDLAATKAHFLKSTFWGDIICI